MKNSIYLVFGCFLCLLSTPASANWQYQGKTWKQYQHYKKSNDGIRPYISFNVTYDKAILNDDVDDFISVLGLDLNKNDIINTDNFGLTANLGIQINDNLGIEAFVQHTFDSEAKIKGGILGEYKTKVNSWGVGADILGYIPIDNTEMSFIGGIGAGYYKFEMKDKYTNTALGISTSVLSDSEEHLGFRLGIGMQYAFSEQIAGRFMARYIFVDSNDDEERIDFVKNIVDLSVGLKCTF